MEVQTWLSAEAGGYKLQQSTTLRTANIQGFSGDMQKKQIPIGSLLAATTTNTGDTVILQAN